MHIILQILNSPNNEMPTDVLGLCWTFTYPKIFADNKGTGSVHDDTYYLFVDESTYELILYSAEENEGIYTYKVQDHPNWEILYYTLTKNGL